MVERGDKNSKFFYAKASNRRRRNIIVALKDDDGVWREGSRLDDLIVNYFRSMFLASGERGPMEFLSNIGSKISEQMHEELSRDYLMAEIEVALK